jgi:hypothetical protein
MFLVFGLRDNSSSKQAHKREVEVKLNFVAKAAEDELRKAIAAAKSETAQAEDRASVSRREADAAVMETNVRREAHGACGNFVDCRACRRCGLNAIAFETSCRRKLTWSHAWRTSYAQLRLLLWVRYGCVPHVMITS